MTPTEEQRAVIECPIGKGDVVSVKAFAGTGKTSCLIMFAEARPHARILYLAYNRAIRDDSVRKFPSNTECKTTHQICWAGFGSSFSGDKLGEMRKKEIGDMMPREVTTYPHKWENIKAIDQTLRNFIHSADEVINTSHVPNWVTHPIKQTGGKEPSLSPDGIVKYAEYLWEEQRNLYTDAKMSHDGYLKLAQLAKLRLNYDIILLDECQDSNPATLDIVMSQRDHAGIVCVGDPYQQMYSFRGSVNAFDSIDATSRYELTHSFRFGPQSAELATRLLSERFGETSVITGRGAPTDVVDMRDVGSEDEALAYMADKSVFIARTNGKLLDRALRAMREGVSYGFSGGFNKNVYWTLKAIYDLKYGERVSHEFISLFTDFDDLKEYAAEAGDREISSMIKLLNINGPSLLKDIRELMDNETSFKAAKLKLTTAHKSKGLEFDNINVADDFVPQEREDPEGNSMGVEFSDEEAHILYVTLTRGINNVFISRDLAQFMEDFNIL